MTDDTINAPAVARNWRDLHQPIKPRAMSRGGRMRRAMAVTRKTLLVTFLAVAAVGGGWMVLASTANTRVPSVAKVPMKAPELRTSRDGVLDNAWLARTLALPAGVSLMELDLAKLKARVLADGQVVTANLTRNFPDKLLVTVTERSPVARLRVEGTDEPRDLLVAQDGVLFVGSGFERGMIESLPWLGGVSLVPDGRGFKPVAGMSTVAQLLSDAQFAASHLYGAWHIVSLARLESDRELEVTTKDGSTIVFGATGDYYLQLLRLDTIAERLERLPGARAHIDLSLGREVPLTVEQPEAPPAKPARGTKASAAPVPKISLFPPSPSQIHREL